MADETEGVRRKYDRVASFYDSVEFFAESGLFRKIRRETVSPLSGKILEVGVGTGKNLRYYSRKAEVTAIDISPRMLGKAKALARRLQINAALCLMDAQRLGFKDSCFDCVVATFVLCSVPYPVKALEEMKRVVKKEGKIILVEHVLSRNPLIAFVQRLHNPLTKAFFGVNINRDTKGNILKAGLRIEKDEKLAFFDVFRRFTCTK